jgi:hypothetical protein
MFFFCFVFLFAACTEEKRIIPFFFPRSETKEPLTCFLYHKLNSAMHEFVVPANKRKEGEWKEGGACRTLTSLQDMRSKKKVHCKALQSRKKQKEEKSSST